MSTKQKTYLIFADGSPEFDRSMRYASLAAKANGANILVLYVLEGQEFQPWAGIEERIQQEQQREAEEVLTTIVNEIGAVSGTKPSYIIEEGAKSEVVLRVLETRPEIAKLIVTSAVDGASQGALLSYFTGAGATKLSVTLTIVPGHVSLEQIDALVE